MQQPFETTTYLMIVPLQEGEEAQIWEREATTNSTSQSTDHEV
jgi:hypothetical protein